MPTLVLATGFEIGTAVGTVDTTANITKSPAGVRYSDSAVNGSPAIVATTPRSGTYCLELSSSAAVENIEWTTDTFGTSKTVLVGSVAIYFPSSLPAATIRLIKPASAALGVEIRFNPTGNVLEAQVGAGTIRTGPAVVADTWYVIDFNLDVSANPHTLDWQVDGTAQTQATSATAASTISELTLGWNASATATVRYDDVLASVTSGDYPLGAHHVELLTVDTGGTLTVNTATTNFQTFSGATPTYTAWDATTARGAIDEVPPVFGASQDGFSAVLTATTDFVNVPMSTYTLQAGESISGARAEFPVHAASGTAATIGFRYITTGSEVTLNAATDWAQDNTGVPAWVCEMLTLADIDTQTELDALVMRVGYSGDANPKIGVHAVYVEVAIKSATSTPVTLPETGAAADTLTVTAATPLAESAAATDTLTVAAAVTLPETSAATDALAVAQAKTLTQSGAATDTLTVTVAAALPETGTAADTLTVTVAVPLRETGAAADALTVDQGATPKTLPETGAGADTLTVTAALTLPETGAATDALTVTVTVTLAEAGAASDLMVAYGPPITITTGGVYTFNAASNDQNTHTVTLATNQPVTLVRCKIAHAGRGINDTITGAQLTVVNCEFLRLAPTSVVGGNQGRAMDLDSPATLTVEHCLLDRGNGIWIGGSSSCTLRIRYNRCRDIGFYANNDCCIQFFQADGQSGLTLPDADIGWNHVSNEHGRSDCEDNLNFFKVSGTAGHPILVHHHLIDGAYDLDADGLGYTGGGIIAGDGGGTYTTIADNTIIGTSNYGVSITGGQHNTLTRNTVVSDARDQLGVLHGPVTATGVAAWDYEGTGLMTDITVTDNVMGWLSPNGSGGTVRNDSWLPEADVATGNTSMSDPIDATDEQAARDAWLALVASLGLVIGPEPPVTVTDSGAAVDSLTVDQGVVPKTLAETGSGADASTVAAAVPLPESGTAADGLGGTATVPLGDSGGGTDTIGVTQGIPVTLPETGSAADALTVAVAVPLPESTGASDALTPAVAATLTQSGAAADALTVLQGDVKTLPESGAGTDNLRVAAAVPLPESGTGSDSLPVAQTRTLTETGTGADALTVSVTVAKTLAEAASGTDTLRVTVTASLEDLAAAADQLAATVLLTLAEAGTGADTLSIFDIPLYIPGRGQSTVHAGSTGGVRVEQQATGSSTLVAAATGGVLVT